jgi:2-keto-4-pentenoate hydratase/2-oxohepta-3-ene-1,7-dioic acid hydratase in catechol pathway
MAILDGTTYDVSDVVGDYDNDFWLNKGTEFVRQSIESGSARTVTGVSKNSERFGAPLARPNKVVCIGLNYADHVKEAGAETPEQPVVFMKATNTIVGPDDDVLIPPGSKKTDYEVELAIIVGRPCRYLPDEATALDAIAGYATSNDVSEREYQIERGGQWVKGKSSETFNPLGPYIVTPDEVGNPQALDLALSVNGAQRQTSNTKQMIFSVAHIVWYLSQYMVLEPGDVINTGTPHGVALGLDPSAYLKAGDVMDITVQGLGTQRQTCHQATV